MKLSDNGLSFLKRSEALRLKAYRDSAGIWTIGYGQTGGDVSEGKSITEAEANDLLGKQVHVLEFNLNVWITQPEITQNQFDALLIFAYNVGLYAFKKSSLLRKVNAGDMKGAAREFPRWTRSNGRILTGLVDRRKRERELFLS